MKVADQLRVMVHANLKINQVPVEQVKTPPPPLNFTKPH